MALGEYIFSLLSQLERELIRVMYKKKRIRRHFLHQLVSEHKKDVIDAVISSNRKDVIDAVISSNREDVIDAVISSNREDVIDVVVETLHGEVIPDLTLNKLEYASGGVFHYSQEGEDIILSRVFSPDKKGFFIDIGAHHPIRFSNTYALYRRGWRGLNLDATPGSMAIFERLRPEDINIECAVTNVEKVMQFNIFSEPALNTFDKAVAEDYLKSGCKLLEIREIQTEPLNKLLDTYWPQDRSIDLMNIDVEGQELGVLLSNNWEKYKPEWIIIEVLDTPYESLLKHPSILFLYEKGYRIISKLHQSVILSRER